MRISLYVCVVFLYMGEGAIPMAFMDFVMEKTGLERLSQGVSKTFKGWKAPEVIRPIGAKPELTQQFKQWVAGMAEADNQNVTNSLPADITGFATWLAGLSDEEIARYSRKVANFADDRGFNLAWLVDPYLAKDTTLKQALEETILLYCIADWKVTQSEARLQAFASFRAWLDDPKADKNQALTNKLFALLIKEDKIDETPSALLLLSEEERQNYIVQTITKVADEDMPFIIEFLAGSDTSALATTSEAKTEETPEKKPSSSSSSGKKRKATTEE